VRKEKGKKEKGKRGEAALLPDAFHTVFPVSLLFPFTLYLSPFSP
jgi:hypothetical protein